MMTQGGVSYCIYAVDVQLAQRGEREDRARCASVYCGSAGQAVEGRRQTVQGLGLRTEGLRNEGLSQVYSYWTARALGLRVWKDKGVKNEGCEWTEE
jgi:hypothetical protein